MADERGNRKAPGGEATDSQVPLEDGQTSGRLPALPELARRALSIGLSGFFLTEETIRKALGDTLPKDWTDFAVEQSDRTRKEFLERLSFEIAQTLEKIDVAAVLQQLLEGRTLEVKAEIRLGGKQGATSQKLHAAIRGEESGE